MTRIALIGTQWGDEAKGSGVSRISSKSSKKVEVVCRYQGGGNAGHEVWIDGQQYDFHLTPSGLLIPGCYNIDGSGMFIDPTRTLQEIEKLRAKGVEIAPKNFGIDARAHITFDFHKAIDGFDESKRSEEDRIGSTRSGMSPTAVSKFGRTGMRFIEFLNEDSFIEAVRIMLAQANEVLGQNVSPKELLDSYREAREKLRQFLMDETVYFRKNSGLNWIFEGAQATMLDTDFGTYPFVTPSNPTRKGIPFPIDRSYGVLKFYTTRVGEGPFPTRYEPEKEEEMRQRGREFGVTTGRGRGCGHLDAVVGRYAVEVNSLDGLFMTKGDVLNGEKRLKICVAYEVDGKRFETIEGILHDRTVFRRAVPVYEEMDGWDRIVDENRQLHPSAKAYVKRVEELLSCPATMISYGKDVKDFIMLEDPLK